MTSPTQKPSAYLGEHVKMELDEPELDYEKAHYAAKLKAKGICWDPMLLSWFSGKTGDFYPKIDCGGSGKPPYIIYAQARGADLTIDINDGEYVFYYLMFEK
jgi:hypothetical protein